MGRKRSSSTSPEDVIPDNNDLCCTSFAHTKDLLTASRELLSSSTIDELLQKLAGTARRMTNAFFAVATHGHKSDTLLKGTASLSNGILKGPDIYDLEKEQFYSTIVKGKQSVRFEKADFTRPPSWWGLSDKLPLVRGLLGIPLLSINGVVDGTILVSDKAEGEFTEEDEALLVQLAGLVSPGLHHMHNSWKVEQSAEALRKSEEELREIVESGNTIIIKMDRKGKITFFNNYAQSFFGYTLEEILGKDIKILLPPTESGGRNLKKMANSILKNPDKFIENINENVLKDGTRVWVSWRNKSIRDSHYNIVGNLAIGQDITPLKRSDGVLRESVSQERLHAAELQTFLGAVPGLVFIAHDPDCRKMTGSRLTAEFLRLPPQANLSKSASDKERPETFRAMKDGVEVPDEELPLQQAAKGREVRDYEFDIVFNDGIVYKLLGNAGPVFDEHGNLHGAIGVFLDVTEHNKVRESLRRAYDDLELRVEERTAEIKRQSQLLNIAHDVIIVRDEHGRIIFWNTGAEETYGWTKVEAVGKVTQDLLETEFPVPLQDIMDKARHEGRWEGELVHTCRDGKRIVVMSRWALRKGVIDGPDEIMEINHDITIHKEMDEALRTACHYHRSLIEASLDPLVTIGPDGTITDVNSATEQITGCLRTELIGTDFSDYFTDPEKARAGYKRVFDEGLVVDYELKIKHKDGNIATVLYNATVYRNGSGKIVGVFAAARDITERKLAEDALLSSLNEKELLLGEIHHRTKNNMQVISGLLDLQASSTGNPELIKMLNESQERIRVMALVHEKLLSSKDFTRIDLGDYARSLSQELYQAYNANQRKISLDIQTAGVVNVDINKATPCGLILNELISNALKHAFPGDEPGKLQISIRETRNAEIDMVVRDNGLGLPDNIDIHQPRSVGLYLVNGLVTNQLGGQIEVRRDTGTEFRIIFPLLFTEIKEATQ